MRKIISTLIFFAFFANVNVSAQIKVNSSGDTYISKNIYLQNASNFLGTTGNFPITFRVNNTLAGFTGSDSNSNVSFGFRALQNTGTQNTAIGYGALRQNSSGYSNTAVGYNALYYSSLGFNNTAIGSWANVGDLGPNGGFSNSTAIGYQARVDQSNTIVLGNNTVTHLKLHNATIYQTSDGSRIKKNIRAEVPGLAFINQLQPVMYNVDLNVLDELQKSDDPQINAFRDSLLMSRSAEEKVIEAKARADKEKIVYSGFIAQDVEKAAQNVGYDFSGIDTPTNGKGVYGLGYAEFVVPLVKAVQELSEQNARLQEQINELKGKATLRSATNEAETTGIIDALITQCKLYQNTPNPFNQETEIRYYLPEEIKMAYLCIYNLQGTQIKQILITQRGEDSQ